MKQLTTTPIIVILHKGIIMTHTFSMIGFKAIPLINHKKEVIQKLQNDPTKKHTNDSDNQALLHKNNKSTNKN